MSETIRGPMENKEEVTVLLEALAGGETGALDALMPRVYTELRAIAWELDPFSPLINAAWGQRLSAAGRFREALERFRETLELEPRFAWIYREMAYAFTECV
ncbi:MAG: hypothetical protein GY953_44990 [bacterium]|nr:hypothetical protein [bacterium]